MEKTEEKKEKNMIGGKEALKLELSGGHKVFNLCLHAAHARYVAANKQFEMYSVQAPQGAGKSSFGVWVSYHFFNKKWSLVAKHMTFELKPIIPVLKYYLDKDLVMPLLTFDDAALPFSKYMQFQKGGFSHIDKINKFITLGRSMCSNIIMISVTDDLITEIRNKSWVRVNIHQVGLMTGINLSGNERVATSYRVKTNLAGKKFYPKMYADIYPIMYSYAPKEFLEWYKEERKKATANVLNMMADSIMDDRGYSPSEDEIIAHNAWIECDKSFARGIVRSAEMGVYMEESEFKKAVLQVEAWLARKRKREGMEALNKLEGENPAKAEPVDPNDAIDELEKVVDA